MDVEFLKASDYPLWNRFVDESPQGDVFCYSWWLATVTKEDFAILAVRERGRIVAGIALPFLSTGRVNEPYLTRTLGFLYRNNDHLSAQKRLSTERKWLSALLEHVSPDQVVQMCMSHNFIDWLPLRWKGFGQTTRYTYLIDFTRAAPASLWKNISKGHKSTIHKAVRNGITIEESDDIELVHRYSTLSFQRQGLAFRYPLSDLALLDAAVKVHGHRKIFKAVDSQGLIHAAFYVVFRPASAYCLLSGGDPALRHLGGHTLLFWHVVTCFSERVPLLNFGGSDLEGVEPHIRQFGGTLTPYFHVFNEELLRKREGIRYHARQIIHHSRGLLKALKARLWN